MSTLPPPPHVSTEWLAAHLHDENVRVVDIRGQGLLLGIELDSPQPNLVKAALAAGILINVTQERVIRLLPPLILTDSQADEIVASVVALIKDPVSGAS